MQLIEAIKAAGIVGEGGAGFPTHIKLDTSAECFIVNAAECEPLIETDKYICRTFARRIVQVIAIVADHLCAERSFIAIKGKYIAEIHALEQAISELESNTEIFPMETIYPAGDEQTIVRHVCGVTVPERGIPLNVGAVVSNVGTILSIGNALEGTPVTDKFLSVVGEVEENIMIRTPLGTPITQCVRAAKPRLDEYAVVLGGPMMGKVLKGGEIDSAVVTKTTGNIIVLPTDHYLIRLAGVPMSRIRSRTKSACIQCRMCTDLCPRYIIGHKIRPHLVMRNLWREPVIESDEDFKEAFGDAVNCCDCGACELFSCPMGLSPRQVNGYFKGQLRDRGIEVEKNLTPAVREDADIHAIPTSRLIARLDLKQYYARPLREGLVEITPEVLRIPMAQHIGIPAHPVGNAGDRVNKGEIIGRAAESGLSANIHAGMTGVITGVSGGLIEIRAKEE